MRNRKHKEIIIENRSKDLEFERKLIEFVEQELDGVLIADNRWRCDLTNSSRSIEGVKKEIAYLVDDDPDGVVLWIQQRRRFWQRERWRQEAIRSCKHRTLQ